MNRCFNKIADLADGGLDRLLSLLLVAFVFLEPNVEFLGLLCLVTNTESSVSMLPMVLSFSDPKKSRRTVGLGDFRTLDLAGISG